jgi:PAS domain S-box-containing protein
MSLQSEHWKTWDYELHQRLDQLGWFHDLFDKNGEALIIAEYPSGKLVEVNDSACAYLELTHTEFLNQNLKNILADDGYSQVIQYMTLNENYPIHNHQNLAIRAYLRTKNGKYLPFELTAQNINLNGNVYLLIQARSVFDRERAEQALHELEAITTAVKPLRGVKTRGEMLPLIIGQIFNLLPVKGAALAFRDRVSGEMVIEEAGGVWQNWNGWRFPSEVDISTRVYTTGEPFITNQLDQNSFFFPTGHGRSIHSIACLPLISEEQTSGVLWVGAQESLSEEEMRMLTAFSEVAAGALNQAALHEQIQRRVQRMAALRSIDMTITASLDLQVTLDILLSQVISHLGVDAATVLLYKTATRTLDFANAIGFRTAFVKQTSLNLGEAFAGQAALERRIVHCATLEDKNLSPYFSNLVKADHFSAYMASPLIAKGEVKGILEIFHRSPLNPDAEWMDFLEALSMQAAIAIDNAELFTNLQRSNMELTLAYDNTLEGWVRTLALRDMETEGHTQRVTTNTLRLAMSMGIPDTSLVHIRRGALLHDIGKLAIPDSILRKAETLDEEEWDLLRQHPACAAELLSPIPYLAPALDIPHCHHEKWDGTGYPRGLKGDQIPLAARIFAVVDVWDALSTDRPYREAWSQEKVIEYLCEQSGKHFDPRVVEAFLLMLDTGASNG